MFKKAFAIFLGCVIMTQMVFPASAVIPGEDAVAADIHLVDDPDFLAAAEITEMDNGIKLTRVEKNEANEDEPRYRSDVVQIFTENDIARRNLMNRLEMKPTGSSASDLIYDNMATVAIQFTIHYDLVEDGVIDQVELWSVSGYVDVLSNQVQCTAHDLEMRIKTATSGGTDTWLIALSNLKFEGWHYTFYDDDISVPNIIGSKFVGYYTVTVERGQYSEWDVTVSNTVSMPI